jgi:hypothetical protein
MTRWLLIFSLCLPCIGCSALGDKTAPGGEEVPCIRKMAVMPFQSDVWLERPGEGVECPLCGGVFRRGRIEGNAAETLASLVLDYLEANTQCKLIPPSKVQGAISQVLSKRMDSNTIPFVAEVGKSIGADAVLAGYIFRYEERIGTSYSVKSPASVGFCLHLVGVDSGALLWRGRFDKTQKALSENVFEISEFFRGGAKWLTADELASQGVELTMKTFPRYIK